MFNRLTEYTRRFAHYRHAMSWLYFYSVIESVFFPVPPDVLLMPLALANPKKALYFALVAALGSATGGVVGYMIGFYAFEPLARPVLNWLCGYTANACPEHVIPLLKELFDKHGLWVIAVSAMSPVIPYRFTILAAGLGHMALTPFVLVSFMMHWLRYSLLSYLVACYGKQSLEMIRTRLPLVFAGLGVIAIAIYACAYYC